MDTNIGISSLRPVDATGLPASRPSDSATAVAQSGNALPQNANNSKVAGIRATLGEAVDRLREHAQSVQRNLEFSVDEASGETVVKVVSADTGELIRQIPSEVALKLAESLKESNNLLFSERA